MGFWDDLNDTRSDSDRIHRDRILWGEINPALVCPHCQVKEKVRTKLETRKGGVSGGKAAGAFLTGGLSLLVTGLLSKNKVTQAHCDNCGSTWDIQ